MKKRRLFYLILILPLLTGIGVNFANPTPILADTVMTREFGYSVGPGVANLYAEGWGALHDVYFEWGDSDAYGYTSEITEPFSYYYWLGDFRIHSLYEIAINHIYSVGATIHFRMRGLENITNDEVFGYDATFVVAEVDQRVFATTDQALSITYKTARLTGDVYDTLGEVDNFDVWFQWGSSTSYGNEAPAIPQISSDPANRFYTADIAFNGSEGAVIHWRIVVDTVNGYGNDATFTIPASSVGIPDSGEFNRSQGIYNISTNWNQITTYNGTYYDYDHFYVGSGYGGGIKFKNIYIPQGSTITSAYLEFPISVAGEGTVNCAITGELTADAADFYGMPNFISRRGTIVGGANDDNITLQSVGWVWVATDHQSPDISSILQEIVDYPTFAEGNSVVFFIDDFANQSEDNNYFGVQVNGSGYYGSNLRMYSPYLHIEYSPSLTLQTSIQTRDDTSQNATLEGEITEFGPTLTNYNGFVWDTSPHSDPGDVAYDSTDYTGEWLDPDVLDPPYTDWTYELTDLDVDTYYVRAFGHDRIGWTYGNEVSFDVTPGVPIVESPIAYPIGQISGTGGADVTSDGGDTITARGVCVSTSINATLTDTVFTTTGTTGVFTVLMTGLTANTTYHLRGYATNGEGTGYSEDITFTTLAATQPTAPPYTPPSGSPFLGGNIPIMPPQMYTEGDTSKIPGGQIADDILAQSDTPPALWWFPFIFCLIGIFALLIYGLTARNGTEGSLLVLSIVIEAGLVLFGIMGVTATSSIIPFFPVFLFPLPATALIMSKKQYGW